jgi:hypothetical protein
MVHIEFTEIREEILLPDLIDLPCGIPDASEILLHK